MTANSFSSVSLHPPLLLVCVHNDAVMRRALHPARAFGVAGVRGRAGGGGPPQTAKNPPR
ncbi:flavin reductase family protein, partial [Streptomyces globisporus]|uniref:flavin reductase family protein n=1 Tax=Streptomyces globisporus TaxID=1908 RepID=UPI0036A34608